MIYSYLDEQSKLPEFCMTTLPSSGELVILHNGERGYFPCLQNTSNRNKNRVIADKNNADCHVTKSQEMAMLAGSMFGFHVPAANPQNYDKNGKPNIPQNKDWER